MAYQPPQLVNVPLPPPVGFGDALSGLGSVLHAYYQAKLEAEKRRQEQQQREQEAADRRAVAEAREFTIAKAARDASIEEANTPLPGERPTVESTVQVPTRSGGSLGTLMPAFRSPIALGTPQPPMPAPVVPPEHRGSIGLTMPVPKPVEQIRIPGLAWRGATVVPERSAPRIYAAEALQQQRKRKAMEFADALQELGARTEIVESVRAGFRPTPEPKAPPTLNIGGRQMGWNAATKRFDIDYGVAGKAAGTGEGGDVADVFPGLYGPDLEAALKKASANDYTNVRQVVEGRVDAAQLASMRKGRREYLMGLAARIDPNFDAGVVKTRFVTRKNFATGNEAENIKSINTAIVHLGTLDDATRALDATGYPWLNKGVNWWRTQTGDPRLTRVQKAVLASATEMAKALKGGRAAPTTEEINHHLATYSNASSPQQWRASIETNAELLAGRLGELENQWEDAFGAPPPESYIRPNARATAKAHGFLHKLEPSGAGTDVGPTPGGRTPSPSSAPRPRAVNPKTGERIEWDGSAWVPVQ